MKTKRFLILYMTLVALSCAKAPEWWKDPKDNIAPGHITNVKIDNINGGAIISYDLPDDNDLLGVKAQYELKNKPYEIYSSAFHDTIIVEGFSDTAKHLVTLFCIDKSYNQSIPVEIEIQPLTPVVDIIAGSINAFETFGGIFINWQNPFKQEIAITLFATDSIGEMKENFTIYNSSEKGEYKFRGFDDSERNFRLVVRDKWQNESIIEKELKPLYETFIKPYAQETWSASGPFIWDFRYHESTRYYTGNITSEKEWNHNTRGYGCVVKPGNTIGDGAYCFIGSREYISKFDNTIISNSPQDFQPKPNYWTIDLGSLVQLSRHVWWNRGRVSTSTSYDATSNHYYWDGPWSMRQVEVWGTAQEPRNAATFASAADGLRYWTSWEHFGGTDAWKEDGWILLAENNMSPPSGATSNSMVTIDDKIYADNGFEVDIYPDASNKPVRYIRFVLKECFAAQPFNFHINQIQFYGKYFDQQ